jgi:hypothetical protein
MPARTTKGARCSGRVLADTPDTRSEAHQNTYGKAHQNTYGEAHHEKAHGEVRHKGQRTKAIGEWREAGCGPIRGEMPAADSAAATSVAQIRSHVR